MTLLPVWTAWWRTLWTYCVAVSLMYLWWLSSTGWLRCWWWADISSSIGLGVESIGWCSALSWTSISIPNRSVNVSGGGKSGISSSDGSSTLCSSSISRLTCVEEVDSLGKLSGKPSSTGVWEDEDGWASSVDGESEENSPECFKDVDCHHAVVEWVNATSSKPHYCCFCVVFLSDLWKHLWKIPFGQCTSLLSSETGNSGITVPSLVWKHRHQEAVEGSSDGVVALACGCHLK